MGSQTEHTGSLFVARKGYCGVSGRAGGEYVLTSEFQGAIVRERNRTGWGIEVEGQHDGAIHIVHANPANPLHSIAALVNMAAVISRGKVDTGGIGGQIGIDLDQGICTITVCKVQAAFGNIGSFHRNGEQFIRALCAGVILCQQRGVEAQGLVLLNFGGIMGIHRQIRKGNDPAA